MKISLIGQDYLLDGLGSAIVWHPSGDAFVVSSVNGEICLCFYDSDARGSLLLEPGLGEDVSVLTFSTDGRFLAAGGQGGRVWIWEIGQDWNIQLLERSQFRSSWIDRLAWHPSRPLLAIATGKTIQLWQGDTGKFQGVLNFESSSVLDLVWDAGGDRLAASGNLAVKIWRTEFWDEVPTVLTLNSASSAITWSSDGRYLAVGMFDRTVMVMVCEDLTKPITLDDAWIMRGFPAKISALAWSSRPMNDSSQPTLAVVCAEGVLLWDWADDDEIGWTGQVAIEHSDRIGAIVWNDFGLAIGGDGVLALWRAGGVEVVCFVGDWGTIAWHPRLPILMGLDRAIGVWRFGGMV